MNIKEKYVMSKKEYPNGILGAKYIIKMDFRCFESYIMHLCNFHFPYLAMILNILYEKHKLNAT